ncbi:MAG: OmpH family outer membrane protein [Hyphomonas sp.]
MIKFKSVFAAIALLTGPAMVTAPIASAQGTVVMVIDEGQILANSKAGKDMFTKLQNIENQINLELKTPREAIQADRAALAAKVDGKTQEAILSDAALVAQLEAFQKKAAEFAAQRQTVTQEYAATEQKAFSDFNKALEPVLLEVVKEKGAQLVVSKGEVVFSADTIDASSAIIAKLDQKTPAITVVRQRAPAPAN